MTFVNLRLFRVTDSFAYAIVAVLLLSRIIPIVMARRESAAPTPRWLVLMASLNSLYNGLLTLFYLLFIFAPNLPIKVQPLVRLSIWFFCLAGVFGIARGVWLFGLRKKLGKAGEACIGGAGATLNEIPPDKPVAS
jgi:drug/metabolite transporter (DMT)-like permease